MITNRRIFVLCAIPRPRVFRAATHPTDHYKKVDFPEKRQKHAASRFRHPCQLRRAVLQLTKKNACGHGVAHTDRGYRAFAMQ